MTWRVKCQWRTLIFYLALFKSLLKNKQMLVSLAFICCPRNVPYEISLGNMDNFSPLLEFSSRNITEHLYLAKPGDIVLASVTEISVPALCNRGLCSPMHKWKICSLLSKGSCGNGRLGDSQARYEITRVVRGRSVRNGKMQCWDPFQVSAFH